MSLSLNQRICAFKKRTLKIKSPKWSILGIALTIVFVEQSVAAPPLLDANPGFYKDAANVMLVLNKY